MPSPVSIALDSPNNLAYVVDPYLNAVLKIDLLTDQRSVLSGEGIPNDEVSI